MACRTRHQVCLTHPDSTIQDGNRRSPSGLGGNNAPTPRSPSGSGRQPEITRMTKLFKNFWSDESGQGLTEYALIIALVAIASSRSSCCSATRSATCSTCRGTRSTTRRAARTRAFPGTPVRTGAAVLPTSPFDPPELRGDLMPMATTVLLCVVAVVAAGWDWRTRRLPNWLTIGATGLGVALSALPGGVSVSGALLGDWWDSSSG